MMPLPNSRRFYNNSHGRWQQLLPLLSLLLSMLPSTNNALELASVANLRPVTTTGTTKLFRSATFDNLSVEDATTLLDRPSLTIVDLRNADEIAKGAKKRTEGAQLFYERLAGDDATTNNHNLFNIPILANVDAFWDETIDRMPLQDRLGATLQTAFQAGALDRAAARHLEQGGLPALYTVMLATSGEPLRKALDVICNANTDNEDDTNLVIFHCQKGKDRTGVVGMLLQYCMGASPQSIVEAYGMSGELLGESEKSGSSSTPDEQTGLVDWSHFRGSPESAMVDTLVWIDKTYGSIDGYLDRISFSNDKRKGLQQMNTETTGII